MVTLRQELETTPVAALAVQGGTGLEHPPGMYEGPSKLDDACL